MKKLHEIYAVGQTTVACKETPRKAAAQQRILAAASSIQKDDILEMVDASLHITIYLYNESSERCSS